MVRAIVDSHDTDWNHPNSLDAGLLMEACSQEDCVGNTMRGYQVLLWYDRSARYAERRTGLERRSSTQDLTQEETDEDGVDLDRILVVDIGI